MIQKNSEKQNNLMQSSVLCYKEIMSFREAIAYLDVSESFLYKLTSSRKIVFFKPNNGKIYFKRIDLDNWMLQNETLNRCVLEPNLTHKEEKNEY